MVAIGWFKPRLQWNLLKRCLGAILGYSVIVIFLHARNVSSYGICNRNLTKLHIRNRQTVTP